jgi:hypothetical protein
MLDSALFSLGIDDLAKLRIMQLAYFQPSFCGDPAEFAAQLGFRSVDLTAACLAELAERGWLERLDETAGTPQFRLTQQPERRQTLAGSGVTGPVSAADAELFRRLAGSSLRRVRRRSRRAPKPARSIEWEEALTCSH